MREKPRALSRRSLLIAAPAYLTVLRTAGAQDSWPPVFEAGRSQFTVVRPHALMPQLRLQDPHGKDVVVAAKPGSITLVNFWATWCAACKLDLPMLASLAASRPERLDVVAICTDTKDLRKARTFLGGLSLQNLACYVEAHGAAAQASTEMFSIVGMPITYLVGTGGRVEGYITGAPDWLSPADTRLLQYYREQS